jgi:polysaccharide biosynthesis protein PelF
LTMIRSGTPFLVTEHGIYTREREMEIIQSTWLNATTPGYRLEKGRMSFFQQWWFNLFRFMEQITYYAAKAVVSITKVNQQYQMQHGADPLKMRLIPNGVSIQQLGNLRQLKKPAGDRFLVGFVGRIVPIKDVKTLIHALKIAGQAIAHLEAYLVGPTEEDPSYFQECQRLVSLLGLEPVVHFTGRVDVKTCYSQLDVLVLTSLSEGQPLVILEASCAGIPVIATDVGACRELLTGISPEDQALGASGIITPVASPQETARAIVELWRDKDKRLRMGEVGQMRIQRYYRQEQLYSAYRELYISQYPQTDQKQHPGPTGSPRT